LGGWSSPQPSRSSRHPVDGDPVPNRLASCHDAPARGPAGPGAFAKQHRTCAIRAGPSGALCRDHVNEAAHRAPPPPRRAQVGWPHVALSRSALGHRSGGSPETIEPSAYVACPPSDTTSPQCSRWSEGRTALVPLGRYPNPQASAARSLAYICAGRPAYGTAVDGDELPWMSTAPGRAQPPLRRRDHPHRSPDLAPVVAGHVLVTSADPSIAGATVCDASCDLLAAPLMQDTVHLGVGGPTGSAVSAGKELGADPSPSL
jgi:hypothetical protein